MVRHGSCTPVGVDATRAQSVSHVYEGHSDFVFRTARRLGVPDASVSDVVQDVFLVVHRRFEEYDGRVPLRSWLRGIVVKTASDHRRRYRRRDAPCVPHATDSVGNIAIPSPLPLPSEIMEHSERIEILMLALATLPANTREALILADVHGMTGPEIAATMGAKLNTIYSWLRHARQALGRLDDRDVMFQTGPSAATSPIDREWAAHRERASNR
jgi:RNA polymerase sigma-70 factor, ECF subfamily